MTSVMLLALAVGQGPARDGDEILRWNEAHLQAIKASKTPPPAAARELAILHIAAFDAVNAVTGTHERFEVDVRAKPDTSSRAAAAAAAHQVLSHFYPKRLSETDAVLADSLAAIGDGPDVDRGLALGRYVAREVLDWRAKDGADRTVAVSASRGPGVWEPTPPMFAKALAPQWPTVDCFALRRGFELRADGPPKLSSKEYSVAYEEVKSLGGKDSKTRTADQTEIAQFWVGGPGTVTPPGEWNRIAQQGARRRKLSLAENARLFALLNVAMADVSIACWDCKYHFNFWRPIQGIREADIDGNDATAPDKTWEPLLVTPPFPSYTSGHSSFSGAAAAILAAVLKEEAFDADSDSLPGVRRSFKSYTAAAEEAGMSRIYGGIHWQFDNTDGLAGGRKVAAIVLEKCLKPKR